MSAFLMEPPHHESRGSTAVSLFVHTALISVAIATIQTRVAPSSAHIVVPLVFHDEPDACRTSANTKLP